MQSARCNSHNTIHTKEFVRCNLYNAHDAFHTIQSAQFTWCNLRNAIPKQIRALVTTVTMVTMGWLRQSWRTQESRRPRRPRVPWWPQGYYGHEVTTATSVTTVIRATRPQGQDSHNDHNDNNSHNDHANIKMLLAIQNLRDWLTHVLEFEGYAPMSQSLQVSVSTCQSWIISATTFQGSQFSAPRED